MHHYGDLTNISKISDNIFLSGIFPLNDNVDLLRKMNIKYIICCVDKSHTGNVHDQLLSNIQDLTVMYLPYNDDLKQNLWKSNKNHINIVKYTKNQSDVDKLSKLLKIYHNKPMIEIGYHFINNAIQENKNVLIHCMAGISRSVSILTYFYMKKYSLNFNQSLQFIKNKRTIAKPNSSFEIQLKIYQLKRERFTENDANKIIQFIVKHV